MKRKSLIIFTALLLQCQASPPLALHQLVEVEPGGEVVLKLHGLDFEGDDVRYIYIYTYICFSCFVCSLL